MRESVVLVMIAAASCSSDEPAKPAAQAAPRASAFRDAVSFIEMDGDAVAACVDYTADYEVPPGRSGWQPRLRLRDEFASDAGNELRITTACAEQLTGRTVFATCTFAPANSVVDGVPRLITGVLGFYSPAVLEADGEMASCLREGGRWQAMARNDPKAVLARLRKISGKLMR